MNQQSLPPSPPFDGKRRPLLALLIGTTTIAAVAGLYVWFGSNEDGDIAEYRADSRNASAGEFVGSKRCGECHAEQAESFAQTGHANTFRLTTDDDFACLSGRQFFDADRQVTFHYHQDETGLFVTLPEIFPGREFPLTYALGSGEHAVTFLTLVPNQVGETVGVEHRVSVYPGCRLARTPGAASIGPLQDVDYFGNLHEDDKLENCIGCHTTTATIAGTELQTLRPHVQCESCHGPGRDHARAMESGTWKSTKIRVTPDVLNAKREIYLCGKCHRVPEMLSDTPMERSNAALARYQPIGILQSKCHLNSTDGLRCTTCHNPHQRADAVSRIAYSKTCIDCHQRAHVDDCPRAMKKQDCIGCHMPRVEVHPGISFHDHWIRIRDASDPPTIEP